MNFSAKHLIKILTQHGFVLKRSSDSHHIYYNASTQKTIVVPIHGSKDLKKGTFFAIIKQAGIEKDNF